MNTDTLKPGKLIELRNRQWIVLPSGDKELLRIKPLGGSEEETTAIFLPLGFQNEEVKEVYFPNPSVKDLGDIASARLLYDAIRLSFRDASGPFRSLAKYNFTPRAYQTVPMIMALRQESPIRLFIADDVGIGKTIESLMVARELLDRGVIKHFAVVCLPHLCEQWADELRNKFGFDPVIIKSSTAAQLDRKTPGDHSAFSYYPAQVISIDFVKSDKRKQTFIQDCPKLVIVDEIHSCSVGNSRSRQQRHALIKGVSQKEDQHLVLLSATPHSGKPNEFQSLLGLLKPKFASLDLSHSTEGQRKELAKHYIQRRRADIKKWIGDKMSEETPFPEREPYEVEYLLSNEYLQIQVEIMSLARKIAIKDENKKNRKQLNYWTALGLVRGVMSSPPMGVSMLEKRAQKLLSDEEIDDIDTTKNPIIEDDFGFDGDAAPNQLLASIKISDSQWRLLKTLSARLKTIQENGTDFKVIELGKLVTKWLKQGFNPIVFCRYINTAEYVGEYLKKLLGKKKSLMIEVITSSDPDEIRHEKVEALEKVGKRVLVATDCMSEGINLQEAFTAVIHYDLPWNPNRLEQREGRVDRFGQSAPLIKTALLYGKDNPMDGIVLKVLLRKAREIKKSIGISVPFPESNQSIMEAVTQAVLLKGEEIKTINQLSLFAQMTEINEAEEKVSASYKKIEAIEKATRSIFAQHAIKAQEVELDLMEAIRLIGDMNSVKQFVIKGIEHLGGEIQKDNLGYKILKAGLPFSLAQLIEKDSLLVSFETPTPSGYKYIARNHPITDNLCQLLIAESMDTQSQYSVSRASVIKTNAVKERTTVLLFRIRNVIESLASKKQLVAEELMLWGYRKLPTDEDWIDEETCMNLLQEIATKDIADVEKRDYINDALDDIKDNKELMDNFGRRQAEKLIEAHERFRKAVTKKKHFQVVEPVLPMDIMGIYIFLPNESTI